MGTKKRMLFIINPRSGRERIRRKLLEILDLFSAEGYHVQVHVTQAAKDAKNTAAKEGAKYDLIVCSGGDGTLNETISGIMEIEEKRRPQIGYIPGGSTNDFAASLKLPKQVLQAAETAVRGTAVPIDIGLFCEDRYFVYVAGFGAFTEVSYMTPQDRKNVLGHQAYMIESVKSLASIKSYQMKVTWEEGTLEGEFIFGMVTNTTSVGGFKGLINQNVALDDGLFEVLLIRTPKTPLELSAIVSELFLTEEADSELVYKFRTSSIEIESEEAVDWVLDGEFGGSRTDVKIRNLLRCLNIRKNMDI
ncbi:diacylglycerol/lipid kinase family protein [Brotaphodocola sp.]|uniref:diacylglycerol/lipid kinase family protein n=1 Tax=Brotaphodocola sp. TaxID=3073577 RepID=UPI003D7ED5A7